MRRYPKFISVILFCFHFPLAVFAAETTGITSSATVGLSSEDSASGSGLQVAPMTVMELPRHQSRILALDLTRNAGDIWDRIGRGFAIPDLYDNDVTEIQLFYLSHKDFLQKVFTRGTPYLYYITDELERRGMPTELALLPMVESSYNPFALSPSQAAGLWQFIPATGKVFNLTQDVWQDQRRDIIASTQAALDYLAYIYDLYGDWHLVIAAYNCGEGTVGRAIKTSLQRGEPIDFASLALPAQARRYVKKLQALKNIVAAPEQFAIELPHVANTPHFTTVKVPQGLDLGTAADLANMPLDEFIALNPAYKRPVILAEDGELIVPLDRAHHFRTELSGTEYPSAAWRIHTVHPGETISNLANKYHLTVNQLLTLNGLTKYSHIKPGHKLLVPSDQTDPSAAVKAARILGSH